MSGQGTYTFKKGAKFDKVAKDWGFKTPKPIWEDPGNSKLKRSRRTWEKLQAGDRVFMPYTDKMKADITKLKTHYRDLVEGELVLYDELTRQAKKFVEAAQIAKDDLDRVETEWKALNTFMNGCVKDAKDTKFVVDTVWEITTFLRSMGKTAAKASKASGEALKKANKEAMEQITGIPKEKAKKAAGDASIKYLLDEKNEVSELGRVVGIVADAHEKVLSPSFWFKTIARLNTSGKGVSWEAWADAVTYDFEKDVKNQLIYHERFYIPAKKKAKLAFDTAIKEAEGKLRLAKAALERGKIHQKKFDKLPSW